MDNEYRVGLVPRSVVELIHHGHKVPVEGAAGAGAVTKSVVTIS